MIDLALLPRPLRFWQARLAKGAVAVPLVTFTGGPLIDGEILDRSERPQAIIRLETTARPVLQAGVNDAPVEVEGVTLSQLRPIDEGTYKYLVDVAAHATRYRPDKAEAAPASKIDWLNGRTAI